MNTETFTESCSISNLPESILSMKAGSRAGCVPYFVQNKKLYFVLGKDKSSGDYTDFGGGVKNSDENVIRAALREMTEETLGVFGFIYENDVQDYLCCYNNNAFILFIPLSGEYIRDNISLFYSRLKTVFDPEVDGLCILEESEFSSLLQSNNQAKFIKFYERTYSLIRMFDLKSLVQRTRSGSIDLVFPEKLSKSGGYF